MAALPRMFVLAIVASGLMMAVTTADSTFSADSSFAGVMPRSNLEFPSFGTIGDLPDQVTATTATLASVDIPRNNRQSTFPDTLQPGIQTTPQTTDVVDMSAKAMDDLVPEGTNSHKIIQAPHETPVTSYDTFLDAEALTVVESPSGSSSGGGSDKAFAEVKPVAKEKPRKPAPEAAKTEKSEKSAKPAEKSEKGKGSTMADKKGNEKMEESEKDSPDEKMDEKKGDKEGSGKKKKSQDGGRKLKMLLS